MLFASNFSHQRRGIQRLPILPSPCLWDTESTDSGGSFGQTIGRHSKTFPHCWCCHCGHDGREDGPTGCWNVVVITHALLYRIPYSFSFFLIPLFSFLLSLSHFHNSSFRSKRVMITNMRPSSCKAKSQIFIFRVLSSSPMISFLLFFKRFVHEIY